jgi:hypothetical protein
MIFSTESKNLTAEPEGLLRKVALTLRREAFMQQCIVLGRQIIARVIPCVYCGPPRPRFYHRPVRI